MTYAEYKSALLEEAENLWLGVSTLAEYQEQISLLRQEWKESQLAEIEGDNENP